MTVPQAPTVRSELMGLMVSPDPQGRAAMRRDMELVRTILQHVQRRNDVTGRVIEIDGVEGWVLQRHVELLWHAGFLEGSAFGAVGVGGQRVLVTDLTWEGHDFLAALGSETVWGQIKQKLSPAELATLPLSVMKAVGVKLLESAMLGRFGLE